MITKHYVDLYLTQKSVLKSLQSKEHICLFVKIVLGQTKCDSMLSPKHMQNLKKQDK